MYILQKLTTLKERVASFILFVYSSCYLKTQFLKTKAEFRKFKKQYEIDSGNRVSLKTLKQSERVLLFFDYNQNIIGQFFINVTFIKKSFYLKDACTSGEKRKKIIRNAGLRKKAKVAEIGAFSIKRSNSGFLKVRIIVAAILEAAQTKSCSYVLAGSFLPFFQEQLRWVLPVELFSKEFSYHGQIRHGKIFFGSKSMVKLRLVDAIFKRILYEISRAF